MYKHRILEKAILRAIQTFPAVVVTGPRQSGKTTLLRELFSGSHKFVSLEDPDIRIRAKEDPVGFLNMHRPPVIFDEIQYVPELLSYIKSKIDANRKPGQWFFTGSQAFGLMQGVSESLAGRAAIFSLLPFSFSERINRAFETRKTDQWISSLDAFTDARINFSLADYMLRGNYPEIASNPQVDRQFWCASYIATYLERDVRNLSNIGDLSQFERFLRIVATRTGQILNLAEIARDIGISAPTAKRWMSVLETGHQVYLLYPYYRNIGKRFIKSPKIYFSDTALASYLLGLHDESALLSSPHFGNLFETMVVIDMLKRFTHFGELPSLYYLRTRDGLEIDAVIESAGKLCLFEIKSGATVLPKHAASLLRAKRDFKTSVANAAVISASDKNFPLGHGVINYSWKNILAT